MQSLCCAKRMPWLPTAPIERIQEGRRLLGQSRRAVRRLVTLGMAGHLTGRQAYADRAAQEMRAIAAFSDWNPSHFLDVAEMTFAMAIGYDWLYGQLDDSTRDTVRQAILEKGVRVPLDTRHHGWTRARNNWGQVCHAGMVAGALAVAEHDAEAAVRTVQRALENVVVSMAMYDPKGSYPEGPGYWSYGTTYNVLLIAMLESALGSSFGLDQAPGFDQTGQYPALVTGPSGLYFNYADGGSGRGCEPAVHWFAARHQRPDWLLGDEAPRQRVLAARPDGQSSSGPFSAAAAVVDAAVVRGCRADDAPALDQRLQGADHLASQQLGRPASRLCGFQSRFALRAARAHGCRFVRPGRRRRAVGRGPGRRGLSSHRIARHELLEHGAELRPLARVPAEQPQPQYAGDRRRAAGRRRQCQDRAFLRRPRFPHSVVDLSPVYAGQAETSPPGSRLAAQRRSAGARPIDRPEARAFRSAGAWSRPASPPSGRTSLELRQGDASLTLRILSPAEPTWDLIDTATPKNEWDSPNRGTVMAGFHAVAPESGVLDLTVVLTPGSRQVMFSMRLSYKRRDSAISPLWYN
jgi:hypothetical protein